VHIIFGEIQYFNKACTSQECLNTGIIGLNTNQGMDYVVFLCCEVLCKQRPRNGSIPHSRSPSKMSNRTSQRT